MNTKKHELTNHSKQVSYAKYLLTLNANRRMGLLEAMKPALREKMDALLLEQKAENIASLLPEVRRLYLTQLKRLNPDRYEVLLPKVAAYESAMAMN